MQQIQSRLSIISKAINNKSLNTFEFNNNNFQKLNFQVVEEKKSNNNHELEFLIEASRFYSSICPSLSSSLICKAANLTSEIDHSKSYNEFFSSKICPKCFSVYLVGVNCKLEVKPIKGVAKKKLKKKLLKLSKINSQKFPNYSFKNILISCKFCNFIFKKIYWEKKNKNANKSGTPKNTQNSKREIEDILSCSNYILNNVNSRTQDNIHQNNIKNEHSKNKNNANFNKNHRFFESKITRAGSLPRERKNSEIDIIKSNQINKKIENENTSQPSQGNSFYDILSMLG